MIRNTSANATNQSLDVGRRSNLFKKMIFYSWSGYSPDTLSNVVPELFQMMSFVTVSNDNITVERP